MGVFRQPPEKSEKVSGHSIEKLEMEDTWSKTLGKR
jgi:hypothetical protein